MEETTVGNFNSKIFPDKHLRVLAYFSFASAIGLIIFILVKPFYMEIGNVKFGISVLLALLFSIFFFILWPQKATLEQVPLINLPIKLVGPIVLWVIPVLPGCSLRLFKVFKRSGTLNLGIGGGL